MDNGVLKNIKGMLVTAFLYPFLLILPVTVVSEGGAMAQPSSPVVVKAPKYRPSLHEKLYVHCDEEYKARVVSFIKTATHEQIHTYLAFVADTLTLKPHENLLGYDDLYLENGFAALTTIFNVFDRSYIDTKDGTITVADAKSKENKPTRTKKKLLDYYLEIHVKEALWFYLVYADYAFAFINFYFMLPSLSQEQLYSLFPYHDLLTLIITSKLAAWRETGDESQSYVNYYQEAFKRVDRLLMIALRTKYEQPKHDNAA